MIDKIMSIFNIPQKEHASFNLEASSFILAQIFEISQQYFVFVLLMACFILSLVTSG
jgi:hypothetical protein